MKRRSTTNLLPEVSIENLLHAVGLLNTAETNLTGAAITIRVNVDDAMDREIYEVINKVDALARKLKGIVNDRDQENL